MADSGKALRQVLLSRIRRAVVTRAELDGPDGVLVDGDVLAAAGVLPWEKLEVVNVTNGCRLAAVASPATPGSGEVCASGAVAQLLRPGELIELSVFGWLKEKPARKHTPALVELDAQNRLPQAPPATHAPTTKPKQAKKARKPGKPARRP